ncbi:MAG: hypothetical protein ACLFVX_09015 [Archaeoglobaceae archaeon]
MEHTQLIVQPFRAQVMGPYSNYLKLTAKSNYPVDIWVVPSKKDADQIMEGGNFSYNSSMSKQRITEHSTSGYVSSGTRIVFANRSNSPITVEVWIDRGK